MDGSLDAAVDGASPPIAYLGDTVADVLTVQRARQQCPDARFLSLAVAPPHLHGPQALERRAAYEARLIEAGADVVLPSTQALEPEALTPELVAWGERYASKAKRLLLMLHPELAAKADAEQLQATTANGAGLLPWDQGFRLQRAKVADAIGLRAFVAKFCTHGWRESWDASTREVVEMVALARKHSREVQQALGVTVTAKRRELEIVGLLLGTVGITTIAERTGCGARRYCAEPQQLEMLQTTVDRLQHKAAGLLHLSLNCLQRQEQVEQPDTPPQTVEGGRQLNVRLPVSAKEHLFQMELADKLLNAFSY